MNPQPYDYNNWPQDEDIAVEYPALWATIQRDFGTLDEATQRQIAMLVVNTCSHCYADNWYCQCWNDE